MTYNGSGNDKSADKDTIHYGVEALDCEKLERISTS